MTDVMMVQSSPDMLSPLARAALDALPESVVLLDGDGHYVYGNQQARAVMDALGLEPGSEDLLGRLTASGARVTPLRDGEIVVGEALFLPAGEQAVTLADREKEAIVSTLDQHGWRLAETAKHLGISRTTLWRRLKAYGLHRDGRTRWRPPQGD